MAGTFKARCPQCQERTPTSYRVEQDAYLCDLCLASVWACTGTVGFAHTAFAELWR